MQENYTARELTINVGERVRGIRELNGWVWCVDLHGREGWIPKMNLERL